MRRLLEGLLVVSAMAIPFFWQKEGPYAFLIWSGQSLAYLAYLSLWRWER